MVVVREAFFSPTAYFVIVPGAKVSIDGKPVVGWLHKGARGQALILTRSVSGKRESYWIRVPGKWGGWVSNCGEWFASRFPLVLIPDVNPPCVVWADRPANSNPPIRSPIFGAQSVEFLSDDGGRLKAVW